MTMVYLNGSFLAPAEAKVSVMDRGFLFGDGVYEFIPVYSRRPFRLAEHLARLDASLAGIRLPNPHTPAEWQTLIERIVAAEPSADQQVYLQVTRGAMPVRNHIFAQDAAPTVFIMSEAFSWPSAESVAAGIKTISAADFRWLRCDLKVTSLVANCLLRNLAADAGCAETLLFRDGLLTEGSVSNIFVVKRGVLLAPPKNHLMLPGITYDVVLELAAQHGLPCEVRDVSEAEVRAADELWLASSGREVLAIVELDGQPIADGVPGKLYRQMHRWYQEFKATVMRG